VYSRTPVTRTYPCPSYRTDPLPRIVTLYQGLGRRSNVIEKSSAGAQDSAAPDSRLSRINAITEEGAVLEFCVQSFIQCSKRFEFAPFPRDESALPLLDAKRFGAKRIPAARHSQIKHRMFRGISRSSGTPPCWRPIVRNQQKTSSAVTVTGFAYPHPEAAGPRSRSTQHAIFGLLAPRAKARTWPAVFLLLKQKQRPHPPRLSWRWLRLKTFGTDLLQDSLGRPMQWVGRRAPVKAA
jgi:hypothetical protein